MIISEEKSIIIELNRQMERAKKILKKTRIKNVAIVNILCLNQAEQFMQIKKLTANYALPKIFHGGNIKMFENMIDVFGLKGRKDFLYINSLKISEIVISYWNYRFGIFPPTVSKNEEI